MMHSEITAAAEAPAPILIIAERFEEFKHELDKLTRKAQRYGNPDIGYRVVGTVTETVSRVNYEGRTKKVDVAYVQIELIGDAPRVGDFDIIGKVEHLEGGNIVDVSPRCEVAVDPRFRSTRSTCEHCSTDRQRKETYICAERSTGRQVQVGSTCLKDFLGYDSPTGLAWRMRYLREVADLVEERGSWGGSNPVSLTHDAVALSLASVRKWGWAPGYMAEQGVNTTRYIVALGLGILEVPRNYKTGELDREVLKLKNDLLAARNPGDEAEATQIIEWARAGGLGDSDYGHNVAVCLGQDTFANKRLGYVASVVQAWARFQEREIERTQRLETAKKSAWVGAEGDRLKGIQGRLDFQRVIGSGQFGDTVLIKIIGDDGAVFTWFTSRGTGLQIGARVSLTGTVKKHNEREGFKETQLTRCVVEELAS